MDILEIIIFILPAYFANAIPVVVGGGTPMDFGKNFPDGRRIFGNGKTIKGFFGGIAGGIISAAIIANLFPLGVFGGITYQFLCGALLSLGTLVGDAIGSFVKRRMNIPAGKPFLLDQLSFLIVALLFTYPFSPKEFFTGHVLVFLLVFTYLCHVVSNYIANKLGLKNVPW